MDWEKAFDKDQEALFEAMERIGIDDKLVRLTKQLYKNPTFKVDMGHPASESKKQQTGIRQECTLSPYLFLIVMTAIMHDIREDQQLDEELHENRPPNHDFDEVLYADDTIILSTDTRTVQKYLHKIEEVASQYGLSLNKNKCEAVDTNPEIAETPFPQRQGDQTENGSEVLRL